MAPRVRFAIHRKRREAAIFFGGDERAVSPLPAGWEELVPREIIHDEAAFDRWIALDLDDRLAGLPRLPETGPPLPSSSNALP
jgi:hypothetical protein